MSARKSVILNPVEANLLHYVKQATQHQFGDIQNLANSVGQAHGGSAQGQHKAAIEFW